MTITGEYLDDLGCSSNFLDITLKAWSIKEIIDRLEFNEICQKHCQENKKTGHILGENICKIYIC